MQVTLASGKWSQEDHQNHNLSYIMSSRAAQARRESISKKAKANKHKINLNLQSQAVYDGAYL